MAWSEGAEAASDDGHGAELGPSLVHHVGAGGVLLAVLPIPPFQVVICAGDGHLHGCAFGRGSWVRDVGEEVQIGLAECKRKFQ